MKDQARCFARAFVFSLFVCACAAYAAQKPKDSDCLVCHSDATLTKDVNGRQVSLYVDPVKFKHSIHDGTLSCVVQVVQRLVT